MPGQRIAFGCALLNYEHENSEIKKQKAGFITPAIAVTVVILIIIVVLGIVVYSRQHSPNKSASAGTNTVTYTNYTDPSGTFAVSYPSNWAVTESAMGNIEGQAYAHLDNTNINFTPANAPLVQTYTIVSSFQLIRLTT